MFSLLEFLLQVVLNIILLDMLHQRTFTWQVHQSKMKGFSQEEFLLLKHRNIRDYFCFGIRLLTCLLSNAQVLLGFCCWYCLLLAALRLGRFGRESWRRIDSDWTGMFIHRLTSTSNRVIISLGVFSTTAVVVLAQINKPLLSWDAKVCNHCQKHDFSKTIFCDGVLATLF